MSKRSRRQTRTRQFDLPKHRWPLEHNASVARAKQLRAWDPWRANPLVYVHFDEHHDIPRFAVTVPDEPRTPSLLDELAQRHRIAQDYRRLDALAGLGWDVRDEMNALAAEEAELMRAEL